jgi:hypothetical protein
MGKLFTQGWYDRVEALLALALRKQLASTLLGAATVKIQVGGSAPALSVQLDSDAFALPAGATRVMVLAFISLQPTTAGEQTEYNIFLDNTPPADGAVEAFGQTGTVVAQLSVSAALMTIITPPDSAAHVYSIQAQSAHNVQIGDKCAAIILFPLP